MSRRRWARLAAQNSNDYLAYRAERTLRWGKGLLTGGLIWLVVKPGIRPLILCFIGFVLLAGSFAVLFARNQMERGRKKIEELRGYLVGETPRPEALPAPVEPPIPLDEASTKLRTELRRYLEFAPTRASADQAIRQLQTLPQLRGTFESLLRSKLEPGELTYQRYLRSVEHAQDQIRLALADVGGRLSSLRALDFSPAASPESLAARREQEGRIQEILTFNETAILQLVRTTLSISEMKGKSAKSQHDLEAAVEDLEELARRSNQY